MFKYCIIVLMTTSIINGQDEDSLSITLTSPHVVSEFAFPHRQVHDQWFSHDKLLHFSVSAALVGAGYYAYSEHAHMERTEGSAWAVSSTVLVALGKEMLDKKKSNYFSWKDLVWDGVGIVIGLCCFCR